MKLGLGTVQFGMDYGISNPGGKTAPDEVARILDVAVRNRVRILDTAALYGTSEQVLGSALPANHGFSVVTKTPVYPGAVITEDSARLLEKTFLGSLKNLGMPAVYGLLAHHTDDVLGPGGHLLIEKMQELKQRGLVRKIGVSVYRGEQIDRVLDQYAVDIIQLPLNVLDQRLLQSGHLARLKKAGVEVHSRSAFLQGLLLMEPADLPPYFAPIRTHLIRYRETIDREGLTPLQAALGFVAGLAQIDAVICGVTDHHQLQNICDNMHPCDAARFSSFAIADDDILNPSRWRL